MWAFKIPLYGIHVSLHHSMIRDLCCPGNQFLILWENHLFALDLVLGQFLKMSHVSGEQYCPLMLGAEL